MKRIFIGLLLSGLIFCSISASQDDCSSVDCSNCSNVFTGAHHCMAIRSQSWNTARDSVGLQGFVNRFEVEGIHGLFYMTPEYTRSFRPCRISGHLFGPDLVNGTITVSGSVRFDPVGGFLPRKSNAWLADYFGLPSDFSGRVRFFPRISNFIADFGFHLGFDSWFKGAYLRAHAPLVRTKWNLGMREFVLNAGVLGFAPGYMAVEEVPKEALAQDFASSSVSGNATWGDMTEPLKWTKIDTACHRRTKIKLSDVQLSLGWKFWQNEEDHMGIHFLAGFPTGGKRCCEYFFAPTVGNGGHFEVGGGITTRWHLWTSDYEISSLFISVDANLAHLLKRKMNRTFELKGKPNSRYMLVHEMKSDVENLFLDSGATTSPSHQYAGKLLPLANISTCCTDVSVAVQGDASVAFNWNNGPWSFDIGYNFWGRTGERFCKVCTIEEKKYALKGDAQMYGRSAASSSNTSPLSVTQSLADINSGTNTRNRVFKTTDFLNASVDNAAPAWYASGDIMNPIVFYNSSDVTKYVTTTDQINTSKVPVFLSSDDFDCSETPAALSHKFFAHLNYVWEDHTCQPFIGAGGEIELAGNTDCTYATISQWGIWLKGGVAFN